MNTLIKPTRYLLLALMATLLAACSSGPPKPDVDYKADYNFMSVKKLAFYKNSGQVSGESRL